MAEWYIKSSASGSGTGANWTNAFTTLTAAQTAGAAGDTYYISQTSAETGVGAITYTFKGTAALPDRLICVNDAGSQPPVAADVTTGATISTTGASNITIVGCVYIHGVAFSAGDGANSASITINATTQNSQRYVNCGFVLNSTASGSNINIGASIATAGSFTELVNTTMTFGSTLQGIACRGGRVIWRNTLSALGGAIFPATLFKAASGMNTVLLDGLDLNSMASGKILFGASTSGTDYTMVNCRLNSAVTTLAASSSLNGGEIDIIASDSTTSTNRQERHRYQASTVNENTIVRASGANNSVISSSHKITTTSNLKKEMPYTSFPLAIWNNTVGSSRTLTVEIVNDGATLTNADIWLNIEHLGNASYPMANLVSTSSALLGSSANLASSAVTWTTTGLTTPIKQKMTATFTPQIEGFVRAYVRVGKPSAVIYVDPKLTIS